MDRARERPATSLMGWVLLVAIGAGALALLASLRVPRRLWSFVGAALMLGAAGYALQGSPGQPAGPAQARVLTQADDPALAELRGDLFGRYTLDAAYVTAADAMTRAGDERSAVRVLLGGVNKLPRSFALWTALGGALAAHDGDQISPPARFAFDQAMRLAPRHPGPPFFLGLAHLRADDYAAARPFWARAVALSPAGVSYRREIALRLALLDALLNEQEQAGRP